MSALPRRFALALHASIALATLAGCDCAGDPPAATCETSDDCEGGRTCIDSRCVEGIDGSVPGDDAGRDGGGADAGRDAGGGCESETLCGSPAVCCAVGDECVEGECRDACASEVRCGADLATCCDDGQVCISGTCTDPRGTCTDSFECEDGEFCEPTLGRCLPQFDPVSCTTSPVIGPFEVLLEWSATTATDVPDCMHAITAPVIVDLDGDRVPEVIANFACDESWTRGVLRAYHGDDGSPVWTVDDPALETNGRTSIAAGDLDGDGHAEIVAIAEAGVNLVYAFRPDGTRLWTSHRDDGTPFTISGFTNGAPSIADLDGDGSPEIVLGAVVLDATGELVWSRDAGGGEGSNGTYAGGISAIADVDGDGRPEVITGKRAYEHDGTPKWTSPAPDGYPAIAQFDADPQPEVALVGEGNVYVLDSLTGAIEWGPVALPGGGIGGPPTIADFDGDGMPEIGVAGSASYSVYDPTGADDVAWSQPTLDESSNTTGSSVFDFEGDGVAEVVYADECQMRVYRGTDGQVQLQIPSSSATIHEYPLVADVDGDGNSEIVIVANDRDANLRTRCAAAHAGWTGARKGLFVYGDAGDQWMRTRRVWNQHAYHVTNVGTSGEIPTTEADNWSGAGLNNYRQNVQGEGVYNAPDLVIIGLEVDLGDCPTMATLRARVANEGSLGAPAGIVVAFRSGTEAAPGAVLGTATTTTSLLPGQSTVVELDVALEGDPPYSFVATVDDDGTGTGTIAECEEDDGSAAIADVTCDILM